MLDIADYVLYIAIHTYYMCVAIKYSMSFLIIITLLQLILVKADMYI